MLHLLALRSLSLLNKHTHTQTNSCLHAQNHPQFSHIFLHQIMVNNWEQLSNKVCGIAEKACLKGLCWYAIILSDLGGSSLKDFHVLLKKKKEKKSLIFHAHVRVKIICLGSISYMAIAFSKSLAWRRNFFSLCLWGKLNTNLTASCYTCCTGVRQQSCWRSFLDLMSS